jgi:glycosyltransferase involved in cell wall biosynthesis
MSAILLAVPWDQEFGGVVSVVGHLARYLRDRGHRVILFHPKETNLLTPNTTKWGFPGYRLNVRAPYHPDHPLRSLLAYLVFFVPTMFQLIHLIRKHDIQIVNVHYPSQEFAYFGLCRWLLPIRLVISIHGADCFPAGRPMRRYPWMLRVLLLSSDAVVAPSRAFLHDCIAQFSHLSRKGTFIYNGVSLQELSQPTNDNPPLAQGRYLLCIAAHNEKKALEVLIQAFAKLREADPTIRLLLVGDGPLRRQHEDLANAMGLNGGVEFLGTQNRSEITQLLRGCEVFVLPSRSEPFGIAITEAMACRKPVVASAVGGIPEIIESGKSGILVDPDNPAGLANALLDLLKDPHLQRSLSNYAYERVVARFQCEHTGAAYERLFHRLISRHQSDFSPSGQSAAS